MALVDHMSEPLVSEAFSSMVIAARRDSTRSGVGFIVLGFIVGHIATPLARKILDALQWKLGIVPSMERSEVRRRNRHMNHVLNHRPAPAHSRRPAC
jgi:hypothetical protein